MQKGKTKKKKINWVNSVYYVKYSSYIYNKFYIR